MKVLPISSTNTNFGGLSSKLENAAATLSVKTNPNRKSIPIEYHNALVKLTAWRVFAIVATLFGFGGYKISDTISDRNAADFANTIEISDIDKTAPIEIKDLTNDGSSELILKKNDGKTLVLDLKNMNVLTESSGLREVE